MFSLSAAPRSISAKVETGGGTSRPEVSTGMSSYGVAPSAAGRVPPLGAGRERRSAEEQEEGGGAAADEERLRRWGGT
jgi:hypothetical protein